MTRSHCSIYVLDAVVESAEPSSVKIAPGIHRPFWQIKALGVPFLISAHPVAGPILPGDLINVKITRWNGYPEPGCYRHSAMLTRWRGQNRGAYGA